MSEQPSKLPQDWRKKFRVNDKNAAYYFMAPGIILFFIFGLYPIIASFVYSFQEKMGNREATFVGLENYARAFKDPLFIVSLKNIFIIFIIHAPIMILLSLILASILNSKTTKCKNGFRTGFFLPNVSNAVAFTMVFKIFFFNDGILNGILSKIGLSPIMWLESMFLSKVVLSIMIIWRWTGYNMVIFLATMQNISEDLYEAADIDGATKIDKFFKITLPMMKNPIMFTLIMTVSGTLGLFAETQLLNNGGPQYGTYTPSLYIYNVAWQQYNFGYASALSYILSIITIFVAIFQFGVLKERD